MIKVKKTINDERRTETKEQHSKDEITTNGRQRSKSERK